MEEGTEFGVIEAVLPRGLYRARLESGAFVTVSLSGDAKRIMTRLLPGDRVSLNLSPHDPKRGRIVGKWIERDR